MHVRADRGYMDHRRCAGVACRFGNVPGAMDMDGTHCLPEGTAKVDGGGRPSKRVAYGIGFGDVGPDEAELADLAERLDDIGLPRIALRNPDARAAFEEGFADVAADESAAAEDRYKLVRSLDHGLAH